MRASSGQSLVSCSVSDQNEDYKMLDDSLKQHSDIRLPRNKECLNLKTGDALKTEQNGEEL